MQLFSARDQRAVVLGPEIARGGEGAIFAIGSDPARVAKRYLTPPSRQKIEKLQVMSSGATDALIRAAAWPTELLVARAADPPERAVAFVMPKVGAPDQLHELYTPRSRQKAFPDADLRFVLHVSANVVRAFGAVHQAGHVIGDVNHGHLLVAGDGRVTLIDCDSFQISANGKVFTCDVGVPLFTAPELQGQSFRGLIRTANHDRFGLAVLLFHLLFMGRHPYAGVPRNPQQSAEIEPAIRAGRFAYGAARHQLGVDQPPGTIPLGTYGPRIASLFESAFAHPPNSARPDEKAWLEGLTALRDSLKPCGQSLAHQFPSHLSACPWCVIEAHTGARLFGVKLQGQADTGVTDLATLWRAIEAVPRPAPGGEVATDALSIPARGKPELDRLAWRNARKSAAVVVFLVVVVGLAAMNALIWGLVVGGALGFTFWPRKDASAHAKAQQAVAEAKREYDIAASEWRRNATDARFVEIENRLKAAKITLEGLGAERARRLAALTSEAKQQEQHLDRFRIDRGGVPGIGTSRAASLASHGVETAWDISESKVSRIPGFGPGLTGNLVAWRAKCLAGFRYNPLQKPAAADVKALDSELAAQRTVNIGILRAGPTDLRQALQEIQGARTRLKPLIEHRFIALEIAKRALADV